jgi:hypothetical protein
MTGSSYALSYASRNSRDKRRSHAGIGVGLLGGAGVIGQRFESARRLSGNTGLFARS